MKNYLYSINLNIAWLEVVGLKPGGGIVAQGYWFQGGGMRKIRTLEELYEKSAI